MSRRIDAVALAAALLACAVPVTTRTTDTQKRFVIRRVALIPFETGTPFAAAENSADWDAATRFVGTTLFEALREHTDFDLVPPDRCKGAMGAPIPLSDVEVPAARVDGWAHDREHRVPSLVVITDEAGLVVIVDQKVSGPKTVGSRKAAKNICAPVFAPVSIASGHSK